MTTPLRLSLLLLLIGFVFSCGNAADSDIEQLLDTRTKAFETKDLGLYTTLISPGYRQEKKGKVIGIEEVKKNFRVNVDIFDTLKVRNSDRTINVNGNSAEVVQKTFVDAAMDDSKSKFMIVERLVLAKNQGKWEIVQEADTDFFTGFVFGGTK